MSDMLLGIMCKPTTANNTKHYYNYINSFWLNNIKTPKTSL